jgi:hypothetical protein
MDLSKIIWVVVIVALVGGGWLLTGSGMDRAYKESTKNLPGTFPEQDIIDEAILSKYAGYNMTLTRHQEAKKFYTAAVERYGVAGKNYWWNLYQIAQIEQKAGNDQIALDILYELWKQDGDQYDERVPGRDTLKLRIAKILELNQIDPGHYRMQGK